MAAEDETAQRRSGSTGNELELGPISPELCLVDPELALLARERLAEPRDATLEAAPARVDVVPIPAPGPQAESPTVAEPPRRPSLVRRALKRLTPAIAVILFVVGASILLAILRQLDPPPRPYLEPPAAAADPSGGPKARSQDKPRSVPAVPAKPDRESAIVLDALAAKIGRSAHWAIATFGTPTRRVQKGEQCHLLWGALGLTIVMSASPGRDPCTDGQVARGIVHAKRWRTAKGLQVGDSLQDLRRKYPKAETRPDGWWSLVVVRRSVDGKSSRVPLLSARVRSTRVDRVAFG